MNPLSMPSMQIVIAVVRGFCAGYRPMLRKPKAGSAMCACDDGFEFEVLAEDLGATLFSKTALLYAAKRQPIVVCRDVVDPGIAGVEFPHRALLQRGIVRPDR